MDYETFKAPDADQHDRTIKFHIGMCRELIDRFATAYPEPMMSSNGRDYNAVTSNRFRQVDPKAISIPSTRSRFSSDYLMTYPAFGVLNLYFGFSAGHAGEHVQALLPVLARSLADFGVLPARSRGTPEAFSQLMDKYGRYRPRWVECAGVGPQDEACQKARYSDKNRMLKADRHHNLAPSTPLPRGFLCRRPL